MESRVYRKHRDLYDLRVHAFPPAEHFSMDPWTHIRAYNETCVRSEVVVNTEFMTEGKTNTFRNK